VEVLDGLGWELFDIMLDDFVKVFDSLAGGLSEGCGHMASETAVEVVDGLGGGLPESGLPGGG